MHDTVCGVGQKEGWREMGCCRGAEVESLQEKARERVHEWESEPARQSKKKKDTPGRER